MKHRIFIAINLPEEIKKELGSFQSKYSELPIRWTKKDNLHITLEFLGYLSNEEFVQVCQDTKELASKHKSFFVTLNKICYGPSKKMIPRSMSSLNSLCCSSRPAKQGGTPKMVWVVGEKIKNLNISPHITLGRIRTWEFKQIEPGERLEVNEEIDLNFEVNSIEVMESVLKKGGAEYMILESYPLKI